jgi:hypothetical protein
MQEPASDEFETLFDEVMQDIEVAAKRKRERDDFVSAKRKREPQPPGFPQLLKTFGYNLEDVGGGGDCLIYCLVHLKNKAAPPLPGSSAQQVAADKMRAEIANHILANVDHFAERIGDEDFDDAKLPRLNSPDEKRLRALGQDVACNRLRIHRLVEQAVAPRGAYLGEVAIHAFCRMNPTVSVFMIQCLKNAMLTVNPLYKRTLSVGLFYSEEEQHYQIIRRVSSPNDAFRVLRLTWQNGQISGDEFKRMLPLPERNHQILLSLFGEDRANEIANAFKVTITELKAKQTTVKPPGNQFFTCQKCSKCYRRKSGLEKHLQANKCKQKQKEVACPKCKKFYAISGKWFERHLAECCGEEKKIKIEKIEDKPVTIDLTDVVKQQQEILRRLSDRDEEILRINKEREEEREILRGLQREEQERCRRQCEEEQERRRRQCEEEQERRRRQCEEQEHRRRQREEQERRYPRFGLRDYYGPSSSSRW